MAPTIKEEKYEVLARKINVRKDYKLLIRQTPWAHPELAHIVTFGHSLLLIASMAHKCQ
jgi:hypothetical protein